MKNKPNWVSNLSKEDLEAFRIKQSIDKMGENNPMFGKNAEDFMTPEEIKKKHQKISESQKNTRMMTHPNLDHKMVRVKEDKVNEYLKLGYTFYHPVVVKKRIKKPKKKYIAKRGTLESKIRQSEANRNTSKDRVVLVNVKTKEVRRIKKFNTDEIDKLKQLGFAFRSDVTTATTDIRRDESMRYAVQKKTQFAINETQYQIDDCERIKIICDDHFDFRCLQTKDNRLLTTSEDITNYLCLIRLFNMFPMHAGRMMLASKPALYKSFNDVSDIELAKNIAQNIYGWVIEKTSSLKDTSTFSYNVSTRCAWIFQGLSSFDQLGEKTRNLFEKNIKVSKWIA